MTSNAVTRATHSLDTDPALIAAAQQGDDAAHASLYELHAGWLFTLIYRLIPRRATAEDLLQDTFVEVLKNIRHYSGDGAFAGWLRSIAVHKCLSHLRSPWQRSREWLDASLEREPQVAPLDADLAERAVLETALSRLSPLTRAVVWLHDVEGYTHGEIGSALGKTASFSKSQLARGHERLRELLSDRATAAVSIKPTPLIESPSCTTAPLSP